MTTDGSGFSLAWQSSLFAEIDDSLDSPYPDVEGLPQDAPVPRTFVFLTGPLLTLGRQLLGPPPPDEQIADRWHRIAANLLRMAREAATEEENSIGPGDAGWQTSAQNKLEWEVIAAHSCSPSDREKLKAALRAVAEPLLSGAGGATPTPAVGHAPPATDPSQSGAKPVKGKNAELPMIKKLDSDPESLYWSAEQWGHFLGVRASTVKGYRTWKVRVMLGRTIAAADRVSSDHVLHGGRRHRR
jgi:hypothetical protein